MNISDQNRRALCLLDEWQRVELTEQESNVQPIPVEMRVPEHVLDMVELTCELPIERNDMSFVIYNDAERGEWLQGESITTGRQPITLGPPYVTATNTGEWESDTVGDKDLLPEIIYGYIDPYGLCRWSESYDSVRAVAPPYAFAKYVRAATVPEGEWVPVEDGVVIDDDRTGHSMAVGVNDSCLYLVTGRHKRHPLSMEIELPDNVRLCFRTEQLAASVPDITPEGQTAAEAFAELRERFGRDFANWTEEQWLSEFRTPDITPEDAQWLELKRLLQQTDLLVSAAVSNAEYDLRVDIKFGYESDHKPRFGTVADAITELQRRLAPKPLQRPTADEWFEVATAPIILEAKWERFKELRERHLAADKWDAAGGE